MSSLFQFAAGLGLIGLAMVGFVVTVSVFLRWLEGLSSAVDLNTAVRSGENAIAELQHDAIADMFDVARAARLGRLIQEQGT